MCMHDTWCCMVDYQLNPLHFLSVKIFYCVYTYDSGFACHMTCSLLLLILAFCLVPIGPPRSCTSDLYTPDNAVDLQWEEPVLALQNGQITGYNLTCYCDDPCANVTADLSATQMSTTTSFIIVPVNPFTQYTCFLSAINEVGEGPATQCIFTTEEASKTICTGLGYLYHFLSFIH